MKKILVFLIILCMSTFFGSHTYEHTKVNTHTNEFHFNSFIDHAHLESNHGVFDTHENHHPNLHQHLDNLFVRSARQREGNRKLFIPRILMIQKNSLNSVHLAVLKKSPTNIPTIYYCNSPGVFSNQPLLI